MTNEYSIIFKDDNSEFVSALQVALIKNTSETCCKDFLQYHFPGLENELSKIINKGLYDGKLSKDEDNEVVQNGIIFTVKPNSRCMPATSFDVIMHIKRDSNKFATDVTFPGLITRRRKEHVEFTMEKRVLNAKDYSESKWKVIEEIFGFELADEIEVGQVVVSGFGVPLKKEENNG